MEYAFAFILLIHGLIHLMGFAKAFKYAAIKSLTLPISKPAGLLWLLTSLLFMLVLAGFLLDKNFWPMLAIVTALLSQLLIVSVWRDAKSGTVANIIVLLVAIPPYAHNGFVAMTETEARGLLAGVTLNNDRITSEDLAELPPVIRKWLDSAKVTETTQAYCARIRQRGKMRLKPDERWMEFEAVQYFDLQKPGFVWSVNVEMTPPLYMDGRDKFEQGQGEMLIRILSLITVVNERNNDKITTSTMLRYLGEISWFPSAALNPYIRWETIDSLSAKATMSYQHTEAEAIFRFNEAGDFVALEAERYYGGGEDATLERWIVSADDYKIINGIKVPYRNSVTWKLKDGDFKWLTLEITDLEVNRPELY